MSKSYEKFKISIKDAKNLLDMFEKNKGTPEQSEVLKRAGLIMAMTAWETYVEDRLCEALDIQLKMVSGCKLGDFFKTRLEEDLKRFHNPSSDKTKKLYKDYLGLDDVTEFWKWNNYEPEKAKAKLNEFIKLRGDVVHHSKDVVQAHPVSKDELSKCIKFLDGLVEAFDKSLESI